MLLKTTTTNTSNAVFVFRLVTTPGVTVALPVPEIMGLPTTPKLEKSLHGYAYTLRPFFSNFLMAFCLDGPYESTCQN